MLLFFTLLKKLVGLFVSLYLPMIAYNGNNGDLVLFFKIKIKNADVKTVHAFIEKPPLCTGILFEKI